MCSGSCCRTNTSIDYYIFRLLHFKNSRGFFNVEQFVDTHTEYGSINTVSTSVGTTCNTEQMSNHEFRGSNADSLNNNSVVGSAEFLSRLDGMTLTLTTEVAINMIPGNI